MPAHLYFYLAISFLLIHEMDAIRCKEWQIFPGISLLNDKMGFIVFMLAHIPLFSLLFYSLLEPTNNFSIIKGLDYFFIIHLLLHLLFLMHPKNEFKDWLSWLCIIAPALFGGLDLLNF